MDKPIIISKFEQENGHLPKHAEGMWRCIEVKGDTYRLQRLKHDGTLGSTRKNNFLKVSKEIYEALLPQAIQEKVMPDPLVKHYIGTRKAKWISALMGEMAKSEELARFLADKETLQARILEDTDSKRKGGKAYSSIRSALHCWRCRFKKEGIHERG